VIRVGDLVKITGVFCFYEASWLRWGEIAYGFEFGFLSADEVVDLAVRKLSVSSCAEHYELSMTAGEDCGQVRVLIDCLVGKEQRGSSCPKSTWIFLTLLWVYVNRALYVDPLGVVEKLYAYFDYPECMAVIVRYMPSVEGEEGEASLFEKWSRLLTALRAELQASHAESNEVA
jgi:hypothetical protein